MIRALPPLVLLALAGALGSCRQTSTTQTKADPPHEEEIAKPGLLSLTKEQLARITTTPAKRMNWSLTIRTTGTVDWDANHTTPAITQVSGPISRLVVDLGSSVTAGSPLLYVASPDVANAVAAYRKAANRVDLTKRAFDRSRDLLDHKAIAQKDFEGAQADYNDALTDLESGLQALKILGITKDQIDQAERQGVPISAELAVMSPIAGTVVQKLISPGQLIQAQNSTCFLISDTSTVWVQGHVYEQDLASVHLGDTAELTNASSREVFHGVVSYIGAAIDAATRTTPVRIVTRNPNGLLRKDMIVDATIHTATRRNVLVVPASAVLHDADNQPFVYVEVEPGSFEQRQVSTGAQQDDAAEILDGVKEGEKVVSEGSVFLQFAGGSQ